jgi:quercetin dioxygenase-like cupin family protein
MKAAALLAAIALSAGAAVAAIRAPDAVVVSGNEKWGPAPPALPSGAQAAVLYGDPTKDGPFVMRLKAPKGYAIPPHTHPKPELVTIISGDFRVGMGRTADRTKTTAIPAGGFFAVEPGMEHYAFADQDAVLQINGTGPWMITYVNPADDPRTRK